MNDYDDTNRGALWKNTRRRSDRDPTHTGSLNVDGKEYWVSGWVNKSETTNSPVFNMSINLKDQSRSYSINPTEESNLDDDVPF